MLLTHDSFCRLCRARDLLAQVGEPRLSIEDVAREARISPFHFIRQFEALFGLTPHQFRIRSRLDQARLLLAKGQYSVTEVCMEIGFASLGSSSDLFTRRMGATPSAYRRRARVVVQAPGILSPDLFPGCLSLMGRLPPSAIRNFGEAPDTRASLECIHANQTHEHHGR